MSRILIVLAALVALASCGAVAYVALHHAAPAPEPTATTTEIESPVASAEPVIIAAKPAPTAHAPAVTPAPAPVSATSAAAAENAPLTREQLAELINNLSPDDLAKLDKAANKRERARQMDDFKHTLPCDRLLSSKKLNLTPDQQTKIKAIKDALKPQMDQALAGVRIQYSQWDTRNQALWNSVTLEAQRDPVFQAQITAESDNYNAITKLQAAITAPLDQQYMNQIRPVLSPDQQQTFDAAVTAAAEQQKNGGRWNVGTGGNGHTFTLNQR